MYYQERLGVVFGGTPGQPPACLARSATLGFYVDSAAFANGRWAVVGATMPALTGAWPVMQGQEALLIVPPPDQLLLVVGAGPRLVLFGGSSSATLWIWDPVMGTQPLLPDSGGMRVDNCSPSADDQTLAWLRGTGYHLNTGGASWDLVELMTAPLPTGALPIQGTVVRAVPLITGLGPDSLGVVSGGYWAGLSRDGGPISSQYAYLVRLADGQMWNIPKRSTAQYWSKIFYLSATEVALLETHFGADGAYADTVVRYDVASLGPGQPCCSNAVPGPRSIKGTGGTSRQLRAGTAAAGRTTVAARSTNKSGTR